MVYNTVYDIFSDNIIHKKWFKYILAGQMWISLSNI